MEVQRWSRGSIFWLLLRMMAFFVVVANFFSLIQVGQISLLGYATVAILLATITALVLNFKGAVMLLGRFSGWVAFVVWLCLTFVISGVEVAQPPIANISLVAIMAFSGMMAWAVPSEVNTLYTILRWAFAANTGLAILLLAITGTSGDLLGPRTCAIVAVLGLGVTLSYWRHGHRVWLYVSLAMILIPLVTLSRTAAACGLILFPISGIPMRKRKVSWTKIAILGIGACACFFIAIEMSPELQSRFFFGGRTAKDFVHGDATLDTSGRAEMWGAIIDSWSADQQTMWIGRGAGSSEGAAASAVASMSHPHNDYLALLHDYGIIGFAIFIVAFLRLIWGRWKTWRNSEFAGSEWATVHSSAFLMVLALGIMMITDNPMEYMFAILPTALMVGSSIGLEANESSGELALTESSLM
jgi:O-antigen ligase